MGPPLLLAPWWQRAVIHRQLSVVHRGRYEASLGVGAWGLYWCTNVILGPPFLYTFIFNKSIKVNTNHVKGEKNSIRSPSCYKWPLRLLPTCGSNGRGGYFFCCLCLPPWTGCPKGHPFILKVVVVLMSLFTGPSLGEKSMCGNVGEGRAGLIF